MNLQDNRWQPIIQKFIVLDDKKFYNSPFKVQHTEKLK
jgi:hypothetical protein